MTGISNVEHGIEHFFEGLFGKDSPLLTVFSSLAQELKSYEETNGADQLKTAETSGVTAFQASRAAGKTVGQSLIDGVAAFFESGAEQIKTITTQAATAYLAGATK